MRVKRGRRLSSSPLAAIGAKAGFHTARDRALAATVSPATMRHLECGSFMPSEPVIERLAKAFNATPDEIAKACRDARERLLLRQVQQMQEMNPEEVPDVPR